MPDRPDDEARSPEHDAPCGASPEPSSGAHPKRLLFEGHPSSGPPRILVRLAHPAASSSRAYVARFDLSIATLAIPLSAARALDLGTIRDDLGLLHVQVTLIFERSGHLSVVDCAAIVVSDSSTSPEVVLGQDVIRRGVFTLDGPADRWSWELPATVVG
jgi:hypothetical protein